MIPFASLESLAAGTLLSVFGEVAIVRPQVTSGYGPATADADRPAIIIRGLLMTNSDTVRLMDSRRGGAAHAAALTTDMPRFWVPASQVGPGRIPTDGDRLELPNRCRTFSIVAVLRGLNGDLTLNLAMMEPA